MEPFSELKQELVEAGQRLRLFTLGQRGVSQKAGVTAIARLRELCERIKDGFSSGEQAREALTAVTLAKGQILAAEARLALLRKGSS